MINFCACMGPVNGEEHCPCRMKALGLKTDEDYKWSDEEKEEFKKALAKMFDWKE